MIASVLFAVNSIAIPTNENVVIRPTYAIDEAIDLVKNLPDNTNFISASKKIKEIFEKHGVELTLDTLNASGRFSETEVAQATKILNNAELRYMTLEQVKNKSIEGLQVASIEAFLFVSAIFVTVWAAGYYVAAEEHHTKERCFDLAKNNDSNKSAYEELCSKNKLK